MPLQRDGRRNRGDVAPALDQWLNALGTSGVAAVDLAAIKALHKYANKANSDLFLYSGQISYGPASQFVDMICAKASRKANALCFLTTPGGDPDAAYRMIRALRSHYTKVRLGVMGPCKSAGTLVAVGAHELVMSETGELGPLDVQLTKPDDLVANSSALDVFQALAVATQAAFGSFENYMMGLIDHSLGNISTITAAQIAKDLAVGIYAPITEQIDPNRLGEVQRAVRIAQAYAEKLGQPNLKPKAMETLVEGYPAHGFVIDFEEAKRLFKTVTRPTAQEREIAGMFRPLLRHISQETKYLDISETLKAPATSVRNANGKVGSGKGSKSGTSARNGSRAGHRGQSDTPKRPADLVGSSRGNGAARPQNGRA